MRISIAQNAPQNLKELFFKNVEEDMLENWNVKLVKFNEKSIIIRLSGQKRIKIEWFGDLEKEANFTIFSANKDYDIVPGSIKENVRWGELNEEVLYRL